MADVGLVAVVPEAVGASDEDGPVVDCIDESEEECNSDADLLVHILID
jgi:hypothetical protein